MNSARSGMRCASSSHRTSSGVPSARDKRPRDALQHEGFAHLTALAPKPEPDGPLAEVVDPSARRRRA